MPHENDLLYFVQKMDSVEGDKHFQKPKIHASSINCVVNTGTFY